MIGSGGRIPHSSFFAALATTAGALALYRLGALIPLPGIDADRALVLIGAPGGAMARLSLFALGVTPIYTALFLIEAVKTVRGPIRGQRFGADATRRGVGVAFWFAMLVTAVQAQALASAYESLDGLVSEPGFRFHVLFIATLLGATAFLYWLSGLISRRGVTEGFWLLLLTPSLAALPAVAGTAWELLRRGEIAADMLIAAVFAVTAIGAVVIASGAADRVADPAEKFDVWPAILGVYGAGVVLAIGTLATGAELSSWTGGALHAALIGVMIFVFSAVRNPGAPSPVFWALVMSQIFVCGGGVVLTRRLGLPFALDGGTLILLVKILKDGLERWRVVGAIR